KVSGTEVPRPKPCTRKLSSSRCPKSQVPSRYATSKCALYCCASPFQDCRKATADKRKTGIAGTKNGEALSHRPEGGSQGKPARPRGIQKNDTSLVMHGCHRNVKLT